MTTDFQQGREALGRRLRELRGRRTQRELAARLGWPQAKVSKLETGRQTATPEDLMAWAKSSGHPAATEELITRLQGIEDRTRSWQRQLSHGHRPVQDALTIEYERSTMVRGWQGDMVVGMLQTADYSRAVFTQFAELQQSPRDAEHIEDAVRARGRRQDLLWQPGRVFHIVMWEAALHATLAAPDVLAAQLDRLASVIGLDTVRLGIVPFGAKLRIPPANAFWLYDERLAIVEDWHAELWLDDADTIALYLRVWDTLAASAVYGTQARRLISHARARFADLA
ncbi:helix-turn-helix domain-containing protein [Streptomyces asoensis]|uniref:helix-turn-helix domain-containing protein n=1 Tax=Streptomyces asoensis TaxID=249586 RepID=UPI0036A5A7BF